MDNLVQTLIECSKFGDENRRGFVDEKLLEDSAAKYSKQAGALNRKSELHLLDIGGCLV